MNPNELKTITKDQITEKAKRLTPKDIQQLIDTLTEKDDKLRYNAFLLLQAHSKEAPTVYPHWDTLAEKLDSDNSYQRSLGIMLIAENIRWDIDNKFKKSRNKFFTCCNDEKFITARQTIQALTTITNITSKYDQEIKETLTKTEFSGYKQNQQNLLMKDKAATLKVINNKK
jgi:hypothetical protein